RNDGRGETAGRGRGVLEHTVDTVADTNSLRIRLQVHVGGAGLQRFQQQQIDQLYDGCFLREADEVVECAVAVCSAALVLLHSGDDVLRRQAALRIDSVYSRANLGFREAHQLDGCSGDEAQIVEGVRIRLRDPGRDQQHAVSHADLKECVVLEEL